jgi:outer membrane protein OmpA-like peptidoglycan-associated protein
VIVLPARANVVGAGTQNFNPTTDGLDYVTVESSKVLLPGVFNLGGFYNYAVNSLPYVDSGVQSRTQLNDTLSSTDFSLGLGLLPGLAAGISIPSVLSQTVEQRAGVRGDFSVNGSTEIRLNVKGRVAGDDVTGFALLGSVNIPRTKNDPYAGSDPNPVYNLQGVADHAFSKLLTTAVNLGYRYRNPGSPIAASFIQPMRNQFIASAAMSYLFENIDTKFIGEVFGAVPAQSEGGNESRNMTSAEVLLGAKHDFTTHLAMHVGAGTELVQGIASPDYRLYTGLNYSFGPVWGNEEAVLIQRPAPVTPVPAVPVKRAKQVVVFSIGNILFDYDSDVLLAGNATALASLVTELKRVPFDSLLIAGHTDSRGNVAYNNDLSLRRANSIRDFLVQSGAVTSGSIQTIGYGPSHPVESNGNYQGRQANRRVEFTIER